MQCAETLETVDFARDGRRVVVGGTSSKVYVYDLRNMVAPLVETLSGHVGPVGCVSCCQVTALGRFWGTAFGGFDAYGLGNAALLCLFSQTLETVLRLFPASC